MAENRLDLTRRYLERVAEGDWEGAESYLTDDVTMHWAGNGPVSGTYHGKDGFRAAVGKLMGLVDSFTLEPHDVLASDEHAVVLTQGSFTRGADTIATNRCVIYHFAGDQISELWVVDEEQSAVDEFLSR